MPQPPSKQPVKTVQRKYTLLGDHIWHYCDGNHPDSQRCSPGCPARSTGRTQLRLGQISNGRAGSAPTLPMPEPTGRRSAPLPCVSGSTC
jgi:hypothetical protein